MASARLKTQLMLRHMLPVCDMIGHLEKRPILAS